VSPQDAPWLYLKPLFLAELGDKTQLLALVLEKATRERYAEFVSETIWRPIGAGDAWFWLDHPGGTAHADCCLISRQGDWIRIGELLLGLKIEDKYALSHVDEMVKIPGIAFGEGGPGDMALSLGFKQGDPRMKPIQDKIFAAAKAQKLYWLGIGRAEGALAVDLSDPAIKALSDEKDALDQQIAALRLKKTSMDEAQYEAQLEKLLTDLALKTKAIRDLQTKKDDR
jgi:hypothetical protein